MELDDILSVARILTLVTQFRFIRKCLFFVVSCGMIPDHIAFIMDGNRRFARNNKLPEGFGHEAGCEALITMLVYCYELNVKFVTAYAFSIDNFKRNPQEVQLLMDLMRKNIELLLSASAGFLHKYGIRVHFPGNLDLFDANLSEAAKRLMAATACNSKLVVTICVGYTSTNEITHAVEESCRGKKRIQICENAGASSLSSQTDNGNHIRVVDIEGHMYMAIAPDPDIVVRTSGETRSSNSIADCGRTKKLKSEMDQWDKLAESKDLTAVESEKLTEARLNFFKVEKAITESLKQKARIKWGVEGDENSSFFHGMVKGRQKKNTLNWHISDGILVANEVVIWAEHAKKKMRLLKIDFAKA